MLKVYLNTSLLARLISCFILGSLIGLGLWWWSAEGHTQQVTQLIAWISPLGELLVQMLKMIVVPVILFSLVCGSAAISTEQLGTTGVRTLAWYFLCSILATLVGIMVAFSFDPGSNASDWHGMTEASAAHHDILTDAKKRTGFGELILSMFENPFSALSNSNFLAIIVFSMSFGVALRMQIENGSEKAEILLGIFDSAQHAIFKMVDWVMEYMPIGVLALSIQNFSMYGPSIAGPYVNVATAVITGVLILVLLVYPSLVWITSRQNPYTVLKHMQQPMLTAFITRSSAATLPISIKTVEEKLGVKNELASFSLPLGATINMDGVCVHLPVFVVLAANLFGIDLSFSDLLIMVLTTVLASIGTGGVPGGSLMLLFIILQGTGLDSNEIAIVVGLALGINPILDMFETSNNVTGDMVCTYVVANQCDMIKEPAQNEPA